MLRILQLRWAELPSWAVVLVTALFSKTGFGDPDEVFSLPTWSLAGTGGSPQVSKMEEEKKQDTLGLASLKGNECIFKQQHTHMHLDMKRMRRRKYFPWASVICMEKVWR